MYMYAHTHVHYKYVYTCNSHRMCQKVGGGSEMAHIMIRLHTCTCSRYYPGVKCGSANQQDTLRAHVCHLVHTQFQKL